MKFYAIGFLYQEDVWFDLEKKEDAFDLRSTCLLPTKELAEQVIEDELGNQYTPVEIEIQTVNKGIWSWSRGEVSTWDEEFEELD
ncbi:hypothetical protein HYI36_05025 [Bacillus sp. Gen3]|nr:hypothetical protein [Bacillus sp. Gen3]